MDSGVLLLVYKRIMKKVKLFIASSLDGYIATQDGKVDWLKDPAAAGENETGYGYDAFYASIDTTLMGYNTYREILGFGIPFPYPDKKNYVFSRIHEKKEDLPVEFVHSNIVDFVKNLKQEMGKDIWLIGGGQINGILLNEKLIDEIILSIVPAVLGQGIPLFSSIAGLSRFKIENVHVYDRSLIQITLINK